MTGRGGARPGAGRKPGGVNRLPSKSAKFNERLTELVEPRFDELIEELIRIALTGTLNSDRLRAIGMILDRAMGKVAETLVIETGETKSPDVEELLKLWKR